MMNNSFSTIVILGIIVIPHCFSIGISSKLDLLDTSSFKSEKQRTVQVIPILKNVDLDKNVEKVKITCNSNGCNKTLPEEHNDDLKTDIIVHVEANLSSKQNKSKELVDETPDVPIIIGDKGIDKDSVANRNFDFATSNYLPSHFQPGKSYINVPPIVIQDMTSTLNLIPDNLYFPTSGSQDNSKNQLEPQNSVYLNLPINSNRQTYKSNSMELFVPYFKPVYNHYFGQHGSPSNTWNNQKSTGYNPVAFNNVPKPLWTPSSFTSIYNKPQEKDLHGTTCTCRYTHTPGLHWFPSSPSPLGRGNNHANAGLEINDKLAPLN